MLEWLILECLNCDVDRARASGWRSEAVAVNSSALGWRQDDPRRFATRRQCLATLRREIPERDWSAPDRNGQIVKTTHHPDYVERFESIPGAQNGAVNFGCFQRRSPSG